MNQIFHRHIKLFMAIGYLLLAMMLYYSTRHLKATAIIVLGLSFFHIAWITLRIRFAGYCSLSNEPKSDTPVHSFRMSLVAMVIMTIIAGGFLGNLAFKGAEDRRMIWAFHEDEGWITDLYDDYVSQPRFDLGEKWGYTYGSFNLMSVSLIARSLRPFVVLDGKACIIINRLLLLGALLATAWIVFLIGKRTFNSEAVGVAAAGLLLTNAKLLETAILSNYPDTFHMLFFTLAVLFTGRMLYRLHIRDAFLAVLFGSLGFSVKYMGLPLFLIIIAVFWYKQSQHLNGLQKYLQEKPSDKKKILGALRMDLLLFITFVSLAPAVMFFMVNPYYAINFKKFISQMIILTKVYANPSAMNHLPASGVQIPGLKEWWETVGSGGAPDKILLIVPVIVAMLAGLFLWKRRAQLKSGDAFIIVASAFYISWSGFIFWRSHFAFFHYILPVLPAMYLVACSLPLYIKNLSQNSKVQRTLSVMTVGVFFVLLLLPVGQDVADDLSEKPLFKINKIGNPTRDYRRRSRLLLSYHVIAGSRNTTNNIALEVGQWLKSNCADARTLVTNETIFYYPPFIKEIQYWNRQMDMGLLFRAMPDLLIVSDWFIDMYTRPYAQSEIESMATEERALFIKAREFYSSIKDKDEFLNYRKIHEFKATGGWYWKRLHIYKRFGPRVLSKYIDGISGLNLMESPNNRDIFDRDDILFPPELYLAAFPGNPVPSKLKIKLKAPLDLQSAVFVWYSPVDHPAKGTISGYFEGKLVVTKNIVVSHADSFPYSWIKIDQRIDKIELTVDEFKGQNRLLLRGFFVAMRNTKDS